MKQRTETHSVFFPFLEAHKLKYARITGKLQSEEKQFHKSCEHVCSSSTQHLRMPTCLLSFFHETTNLDECVHALTADDTSLDGAIELDYSLSSVHKEFGLLWAVSSMP